MFYYNARLEPKKKKTVFLELMVIKHKPFFFLLGICEM